MVYGIWYMVFGILVTLARAMLDWTYYIHAFRIVHMGFKKAAGRRGTGTIIMRDDLTKEGSEARSMANDYVPHVTL